MVVHLREERARAGLTLRQASEALGDTLKRSSLWNLEHDVYLPTLRQLEQLATLYGCHPLDLVTFVGFPPPRRCLCSHTLTPGEIP